jgi:hypothetical protein
MAVEYRIPSHSDLMNLILGKVAGARGGVDLPKFDAEGKDFELKECYRVTTMPYICWTISPEDKRANYYVFFSHMLNTIFIVPISKVPLDKKRSIRLSQVRKLSIQEYQLPTTWIVNKTMGYSEAEIEQIATCPEVAEFRNYIELGRWGFMQ